MKSLQQYGLLSALRPFSLAVAIISCSLGILIAWNDGSRSLYLAVLILVGGIAAQAGINLINDVEDLKDLPKKHADAYQAQKLILRNMKAGLICILLAVLVAVYLVFIYKWPLFLLISFSAIAALGYNLGPINFKHRGLAIIQVFLLMGVVMVQGAYYSMAGQFSMQAFYYSLPVSMLISLLLLSNELRDWEIDRQKGIGTLTVRMGYKNGVRLYWLLIIGCYALSILFFSRGQLQSPLWLVLPLPLLLPIHNYLKSSHREPLTPLTGRFFFLFGMAYILTISSQQL